MTDFDGSASLPEALHKFAIELPEEHVTLLDRYRALLWEWNEKLNLTRHTQFDTFVSRDIVDSIQLAELLAPGEEVLDVGSGGGVPGVILKIVRPDLDVTMCESIQKKAQVLTSMVRTLGLRAAVHPVRAEILLEDFRYDSVVARAVGPLWKICTWFAPYWHNVDRLLLVKGPKWTEERAAARERGLLAQLDLRRVAAYPMAGTYSESVILQLTRRRPPPE